MINRSSGELKRLAREFLTGNYTILISALLITFFTPVIMISPFSANLSASFDFTTVSWIIAAGIIRLIGQLFAIGVTRIHLLLAKKQPVSLTDIFWSFRNHPDRFILAALLSTCLMLLPLIPAILCIVSFPGGIVKTKRIFYFMFFLAGTIALCIIELYLLYMYKLIYPLYIDHPEMKILTGFRTSRTMMHGNKRKLFLLQLSFIGWIMLGICSCGIGFLWIFPYIKQTSANFYLDLTGSLHCSTEHIDIVVSD